MSAPPKPSAPMEGQGTGEHWSFKDSLIPPGEPVPGKTYRADGWQYVDLPKRLSLEMRDYFLSRIGNGEYVILAQSEGDDWWRAQLLISPAGQRNLANPTPENEAECKGGVT